MCSVCAEQQHKFHLTQKNLRLPAPTAAMFIDSPKADAAVFSKFLPHNNLDDSDDSDPYSSDQFRMYEFKIRKCTRSRSHDWTDCPFAHPGEKARRRDPRRFNYSGTICPEYRKSGGGQSCGKGDDCEFSHGVFECWLHPTRYRTEACKDGKLCKRKVCFFAHSTRQLRSCSSVPDASSYPSPINSPTAAAEKTKYHGRNLNRCCGFCCHSVVASPTSTLLGVSNLYSPPVSPVEFSRYGDRLSSALEFHNGGILRYKDALAQVMASLEAMKVNEAFVDKNPSWIDVNSINIEEQPQFLMSPSTPTPGSNEFSSGRRDYKFIHEVFSNRDLTDHNNPISSYSSTENNSGGPDLGWVNDLLT